MISSAALQKITADFFVSGLISLIGASLTLLIIFQKKLKSQVKNILSKYNVFFNVTGLSVLRPQQTMKPYCLLILLVAFACIQIKAQHYEVATKSEPGFKEQPANVDRIFSLPVCAPELQLAINGLSILGRQGYNGLADNYFSSKNAGRSKWKYENLLPKRKAVTGLLMMAGSIPYLIMALQTKHKGLSLCSQKTTYGSFNKARKKVTGITFSIPIGK